MPARTSWDGHWQQTLHVTGTMAVRHGPAARQSRQVDTSEFRDRGILSVVCSARCRPASSSRPVGS
jgi:hypothetical protein